MPRFGFGQNNTLVGRDRESGILQNLWHQVQEKSEAPSKICLLHGAAGSGKTSLAKYTINCSSCGYFISLKFDQFKDFSAPYSEIVSAFEQLSAQAPRKRIKDCLTTEASILGRLIPSFEKIFSEDAEEKDPNPSTKTDNAVLALASERLTIAFQVFLRQFCSADHPVILLADDLQWSDKNSCRLLGDIANDSSIHNFLFIACYRDEEASKFDLGIDVNRPVTNLAIGPLGAESVDALIGQMIHVPTSDDHIEASLSDFGHLVHRKTLGNPYFVVQFMETLQARELLKYNFGKWEWDTAIIAENTKVSESVVDVLRDRIELISVRVQTLLILTAFLGFMVQVEVIQMLEDSNEILDEIKGHLTTKTKRNTNNDDDTEIDSQAISTLQALEKAKDEGFIEILGHYCRFSHDRIQECIYALIPDRNQQARLHYLIGKKIWDHYGESDPIYIFQAADQLNRGASYSDEDRLLLIKLNFKASLEAKAKLGIDSVGTFVDRAILAVKEKFWEHSYDMLIDLYNLAAEVEFSRGHFDASEGHTRTVLYFAKHQKDAFRSLVTRALANGVKRDFAQGIRECRFLLGLLGIKMRKSSTLSFLLELTETKSMLKSMDNGHILQLQDMELENMKLAMKLLQHGSIFGWNSDTTFAGLCYLRMIRLTMQHGWCDVTPYALAGYGFILAALGQEKEAFRFSQLALTSSKSKLEKPDVNMMVHAFLAHFERPVANSLAPLLAGYRAGLETGDMICGAICMSVYAHVYLFSGLPLVPFATDMGQFTRQLKTCRQDLALAFILPALQLALNLSGKASDPMDVSIRSIQKLEGCNNTMFIDTTTEDPTVLFVYYLQAFSGYLLGDIEYSQKALDKVYARHNRRLEGTQILNIFFTLVDGLVSFASCRQKKKSTFKYKRRAWSAIKKLESLAKKRSVNCAGILALLKAENASFSKKRPAHIRRKYDDAIAQLTRSGFLHYAAIANELAGQHMLLVHDKDRSDSYLTRAASKYFQWGAVAKVEQMKKKHSTVNFDEITNGCENEMFIQGRSQYDSCIDSVKYVF